MVSVSWAGMKENAILKVTEADNVGVLGYNAVQTCV
jgi:hypothetical protein